MTAPTAAQLVVWRNGDVEVFELIPEVTRIGRKLPGGESSVEVAINSSLVAREHARILRIQAEYWIEDGGSSGGTWVNGRQIQVPTMLHCDDRIRIGRTLMRFVSALDTDAGHS